ncbi:MAG: response regulator [Terriglobia bacterium]
MEPKLTPAEISATTAPAKTRILLVDDHELVRKGLRTLLEANPRYQVCGEASDGRQAVEKAHQLRPDIVVMDVCMPELNGLEAAREIKKALTQTEVLALTITDSEQLAQKLLSAGVRGYLSKSDAARDLLAGVESLREHKPFFNSKVAQMVLDGYLKAMAQKEAVDSSSAFVTERERQIIQLLAEGNSNKEVADALGITVKTAETHRANIMHKLNLHSVGDVVRYAVRNQMIEP